MTYRLKTFRVQFIAEPAEFPAGSPCRASADVERLARAIYQTLDADKEHFLLLAMNNKNRLNGFKVIDGKPDCIARASSRSMALGASPLRCCRHICSQPPKRRPCSQEDQEITRRLKETGEMLGIRVLDHVVLGDGRFFSFSDRGLI